MICQWKKANKKARVSITFFKSKLRNAVPASIKIEVFGWKLPHAVTHPLMVTVGRWFCLSKDTDNNCVILYPWRYIPDTSGLLPIISIFLWTRVLQHIFRERDEARPSKIKRGVEVVLISVMLTDFLPTSRLPLSPWPLAPSTSPLCATLTDRCGRIVTTDHFTCMLILWFKDFIASLVEQLKIPFW